MSLGSTQSRHGGKVRRYPERAGPKRGMVEAFIDKVLDEDVRAPRKQRHTARRIHRRILSEFLTPRSPGRRCATMCASANARRGCNGARRSCRKLQLGSGGAGLLV
jgi:hypothetical protein